MADRYFKVNKISVRYGDVQVLQSIEFIADKGEIVALVGSDGTGKSMAVKSCTGLLRPFQGNICLDGYDLTGAAYRTFIGHGTVLAPEGRQSFPSMTIYENLKMGASSKAVKAARKDVIEWIRSRLPELKDRKNQLVDTLSGNEQQMLVLSRDMMRPPKFLIMDESSLGPVPGIVGIIFSVAKEMTQKSGFAIILMEQDIRKAPRIANRGYVIEDDQITVSGTAEELLDNDEVEKAYLGFQSVCEVKMRDGSYMGQSNKRRRNT